MRDAFRGEHLASTISERWRLVDQYFDCITQCNLDDETCVSQCMRIHLKPQQASELS